MDEPSVEEMDYKYAYETCLSFLFGDFHLLVASLLETR